MSSKVRGSGTQGLAQEVRAGPGYDVRRTALSIPDPVGTRGLALTCAEGAVRSCPNSSRARTGAPVMAGWRAL